MENKAIEHLSVSKELAINFLATYSRLEYALKVTDYPITQSKELKADWIKFTREIHKTFDHKKNNQLSQAFLYLLNYPLHNYMFINNQIHKMIYDVSKEKTDIDKVVLKIKQIRNNLFHGGKNIIGNPQAPNSDTELLTHSITVLLSFKVLVPAVNNAYDY